MLVELAAGSLESAGSEAGEAAAAAEADEAAAEASLGGVGAGGAALCFSLIGLPVANESSSRCAAYGSADTTVAFSCASRRRLSCSSLRRLASSTRSLAS